MAGVAYWPVSVTEGTPSDAFVVCCCIERGAVLTPSFHVATCSVSYAFQDESLDGSIQCRYKQMHNSF